MHDLQFYATVFQSYQDNRKVIMNGYEQWNPVYDWFSTVFQSYQNNGKVIIEDLSVMERLERFLPLVELEPVTARSAVQCRKPLTC